MYLKLLLSDKTGLMELYNFDVHQIYIRLWHQFEQFNLIYFTHSFSIHSNLNRIVIVLIFNFCAKLNGLKNALKR